MMANIRAYELHHLPGEPLQPAADPFRGEQDERNHHHGRQRDLPRQIEH
jgi:hypothetical protein